MVAVLLLVMLVSSPVADSPVRHPRHFHCRGLEAYDIEGTYDVDWMWGTIHARDGSIHIGFTTGPMAGELVPAQRPTGFRTFHVVRVQGAVLRYGFNARDNQIQATLLGAPFYPLVNLVSQPKDAVRFLEVAKILATAPCEGRIDRR